MKSKKLIFSLVFLAFFLSIVAIGCSIGYAQTSKRPFELEKNNLDLTHKAPITHTFTGSISTGQDSTNHQFNVPAGVLLIEVELQMPSGADYDLSLWDDQNRRTGGWTSSDRTTRLNIPNSDYSGYSANPEWIDVDPPSTFGTWSTGCYSYSGSGTYTITVIVTSPESDTIPPSVSITSPSDGSTVYSSDVTVSWTGSDNVGIDYYETRINGGSWINKGTSTSHTYTGLAEGSNSMDVRAWDAAGNSDIDTVTFTVDTAGGPITHTFTGSISSGQDSTTHQFNVPVDMILIEVELQMPSGADYDLSLWDDQNRRTGGWTSSDRTTRLNIPNSVYSGYSANPEWIDVDPPSTFGTWSTGCYSYSGSGTYTITVIITPGGPDTTPPTISITNPSDGDIVYSSDVTVSWSGSDNVGIAYYETRINGGSWINKGTSSSHLYTGLADGGYSVDVRAWDVAGNSDTDTVAFTVDATGNPVEKYAVIVGISDYKAINDLSYCDEDATDWYNHLTGTGMAFDHVWVYGDGHTSNFPQHDGYATEYNVKQALINVVNSADSNDIIVFTTSGHGSGNGAGSSYLCMWDCGAGESGEDGDFYDTELSAILDGAIADKIFVFIDHCYSGGFGPDLLSMPNSADIYCTTTCTENGYGYDVPSYQNGAWTYYFLEYSWINHYGGSTSVSMEDVFTYAHNNYPYGGGDEPQEFDGDTSTFFYLS